MAITETVIVIFVVIISFLISRKQLQKRRNFSVQNARAKQFLSPPPSNPTNPNFIPLLQRMHLLITYAFIAEIERQMDKASEYYYWAFILDQDLDHYYEKKLLSCLETTSASPKNQRSIPPNIVEFDIEINNSIKRAQDAEQKNDRTTALQLYITANTLQCQAHLYLDAIQTAKKISQLRKMV